ncbi:nuclear pore protein [Tubulinosema ratisbonensis]|uniref:Nuclear protein localization protein 4 n=1 Tax=Tubulinosema ratisbonensis TaxID=291195 RepID=A0A437ANU2_9MICR|nr:nuclear pore protein [Tubulinosema ratisbonensis]
MILRIITPEERKRIEVNKSDTLTKIITTHYKCKSFTVRLTEESEELDGNLRIEQLNLKENSFLFVDLVLEEEIKPLEVKEEEERLKVKDGKLIRKQDKMLCNHPSNEMCINCAPLDVYDKTYHLKNKIKYLSYAAYLKKGIKEEVHLQCKHSNNEKCANCMNKTHFLQVQQYRRIDHVEIHCKNELEHFFMLFAQTKKHRIAFLLGEYTDYDFIPLGRKAVVKTLYYPEQKNFPDGFILLEKEKKDTLFNLQMVGVIFTAPKTEFFINNLQLFLIKELQSKNENLVSLILKEDELEECMASDLLIKLEDRIKCCENPRMFRSYVDFQYRENDIVKRGKFVPVEYFLVRLTHGYKENDEMFVSPFFLERNCGMKKINKYFNNKFNQQTLSNYELVSRLSKEMDVSLLCKAIIQKDDQLFDQFIKSKQFSEFIKKLSEFDEEWQCNTCTFMNNRMGEFCEMCNSKRVY